MIVLVLGKECRKVNSADNCCQVQAYQWDCTGLCRAIVGSVIPGSAVAATVLSEDSPSTARTARPSATVDFSVILTW